jgi:hypothetical protein
MKDIRPGESNQWKKNPNIGNLGPRVFGSNKS